MFKAITLKLHPIESKMLELHNYKINKKNTKLDFSKIALKLH